MFTRPDLQSYTRFLLWAGVALLLTAFIAPAIVLRETSVLEISRHRLSELTPVARAELERRQRFSRDTGHATIYVMAGAALSGLLLIGYALPGMRRRERADDAYAAASLEKLLAEVEPQSASDRDEAVRAEVREVAAAPAPAAASPSQPAAVRDQPPRMPVAQRERDRMRRAREAHRRVLERIGELASASQYEFRPDVKFTRESSRLLLDGLLASRLTKRPDVVVEITLVDPRVDRAQQALDQLIAHVVRYRTRTSRSATGWLVLVIADVPGVEYQSTLSEVPYGFMVTIVREASVDDLSLPDFVRRPR